ncbi:MAG: universal stress protein [Candidatus Hydrogenedentes bacterium]|nr:universal stress protein [Candidatus Hydrogenedentota bacterium]
MFRNANILVPTDFSTYANYALKYAVAMAKQFAGTIHYVHVLDRSALAGVRGNEMWLAESESHALIDSMREHATIRMTNLKQIADDEGVKSETHVVLGNPTEEILRLAEQTDSTLIVMATHGRSGVEHLVFGSVAEKIVRQSPVPVLSVKHPEHEFVKEYDMTLEIKRVLFPTDFSPFSDKALPFAKSFVKEFNATLIIFHATEVPIVLPEVMSDSAVQLGPQLEDESRQLVQKMCENITDVKVEGEVRVGTAFREIASYAERAGVDLIVVPTHGRSGLSHVLFGSVAEKVVRVARCPVLTIRPEYGGEA